jgi:competence protein ComEA
VQRYLLVALGLGLAAFVIWHPPARPPVGLTTQSQTETLRRPRRAARPFISTRIVVYVAGEVRRPGLYRLAPGARIDDAVRQAGGMLPDADPLAVDLAQQVSDGDEVAVVARGAALPRRTLARSRSGQMRSRTRQTAPAQGSIDPNLADTASLARVPGIGPAVAQRIVTLREADGPFASADELLDVAGMTPARLDRASPYLFFSR